MSLSSLISVVTSIIMALGHVWGQGVVRVELPAEEENDYYDIIPCDTFGILTIYETPEIVDAEHKKWEFTLFDTLLNTSWTSEVPVLFGAEYQHYHFENETLYLLFMNTRRARTSLNNLQVFTISFPEVSIRATYGAIEDKAEPVWFSIIGQKAVIGVNTRKDKGVVYFLDLLNSEISETIINIMDQSFVNYVHPNKDGISVDIAAVTYVNRRQNGLVIFNTDLNGNIRSSMDIITGPEERYLNSARIVQTSGEEWLVIGTYNSTPGRIPGSDDYDYNQSAGVYAAKFTGTQQDTISFYNFLDFENLRTGMSRKEYYKMQRRSHKENTEFSLDYSLLVHDIDTLGGNYLLLLESFYPDYKTVSDITYDYWGRPIPQSYTVFEGYRYISAIVAAFDKKGELTWDNSMEIYNISAYDLGYKVDYLIDSTDLVFFYNEGGKITYKAIEKDLALTDLEHTELAMPHAGDKILESAFDNMDPWYDGYFLCYGYQKIRNNSMIDMNRRTIFYISKVAFQ